MALKVMNKTNKWQIEVFVNEEWISYSKKEASKALNPSLTQNVKSKLQILKNKRREGFGYIFSRISKTGFRCTSNKSK